ncbi:hypothetical protein ABIC28_001418 [Rhodococcus sp. PvR044]|jgi:hypothetical protein|nr:hypothetical protein [Rhodococcus sp. PvR099]
MMGFQMSTAHAVGSGLIAETMGASPPHWPRRGRCILRDTPGFRAEGYSPSRSSA